MQTDDESPSADRDDTTATPVDVAPRAECCTIDHARRFLLRAGLGLGALSVLDVLGGGRAAAQPSTVEAMNVGVLGAGQYPARAKRVIMLHMLGAISHVDTFDYKPMLEKMTGQEIPQSVRETPSQAHLDLLSRYYHSQREVFSRDKQKASALLGVGVVKPDPALDRASLAAMANVAALVMSSPDAYTVR